MSTVENHQHTCFLGHFSCVMMPPVGGLGLKVLFWRSGIDLQINYNINKVSKKVQMSASANEPNFRMRLLAKPHFLHCERTGQTEL